MVFIGDKTERKKKKKITKKLYNKTNVYGDIFLSLTQKGWHRAPHLREYG